MLERLERNIVSRSSVNINRVLGLLIRERMVEVGTFVLTLVNRIRSGSLFEKKR